MHVIACLRLLGAHWGKAFRFPAGLWSVDSSRTMKLKLKFAALKCSWLHFQKGAFDRGLRKLTFCINQFIWWLPRKWLVVSEVWDLDGAHMRPVTNFWTASKKNNLLYLSKNGAVERALNSPMLVMTPTPQNAAVPMVPAAEFVERYFMLFLAWSFWHGDGLPQTRRHDWRNSISNVKWHAFFV